MAEITDAAMARLADAMLELPVDELLDLLADRLAARMVPRLAEALDGRPVFTMQTAAEHLGIGASKLYRLIREGRLHPVRIDGQQRILRTEMARFLDAESQASRGAETP